MSAQLELFEQNDPISIMQKEIDELKAQNSNLRKSFFARLTEHASLLVELQNKFKLIEEKSFLNVNQN